MKSSTVLPILGVVAGAGLLLALSRRAGATTTRRAPGTIPRGTGKSGGLTTEQILELSANFPMDSVFQARDGSVRRMTSVGPAIVAKPTIDPYLYAPGSGPSYLPVNGIGATFVRTPATPHGFGAVDVAALTAAVRRHEGAQAATVARRRRHPWLRSPGHRPSRPMPGGVVSPCCPCPSSSGGASVSPPMSSRGSMGTGIPAPRPATLLGDVGATNTGATQYAVQMRARAVPASADKRPLFDPAYWANELRGRGFSVVSVDGVRLLRFENRSDSIMQDEPTQDIVFEVTATVPSSPSSGVGDATPAFLNYVLNAFRAVGKFLSHAFDVIIEKVTKVRDVVLEGVRKGVAIVPETLTKGVVVVGAVIAGLLLVAAKSRTRTAYAAFGD